MVPHEAHGPADDATVLELVEALLEGDRSRARALVLEHLDEAARFSSTVDGLARPAMEEIGRRWADGEIGVSDEHRATAVMQTVLARAYADSDAMPLGSGRALVACVAGNEHALGARSLADALDLAGWQVRYLGPDVEVDVLVEEAEAFRPDVVGLSVSLEDQEPAAHRAVERLHALEAPAPRILLGGSLPEGAARAEEAGADGWAFGVSDALEALA